MPPYNTSSVGTSSPASIPDYEVLSQRIHNSLDRIFNKLEPVLTNFPRKESSDEMEQATTVLTRFSDIARRLEVLEDRITI